jgi:lysophospholipase L1-like esterase
VRGAIPILVAALAAGCSSGGSPAAPTRPSGAQHQVSGIVGYDENGDGTVQGSEAIRFGLVTVRAGEASTITDPQGRFQLTVPDGRVTFSAGPDGLPPFFESRSHAVDIGGASDVAVPVTLPIGTNRPHVYMAFGDSISFGTGSRSGSGYRDLLADKLRGFWGRGEVVNEGASGTPSDEGAARIAAVLRLHQPAYTLIHYGTNDWHNDCRQTGNCPTIPSLRAIVREAKAARSNPVLATLLPVHPASEGPVAEARSAWVEEINGEIRQLARAENVPLADVNAVFKNDRDPARLFADDLHPNDRGYELIAEEFFKAVARPRG